MDEKLTNEVLGRLDALAEKLGTTTEYLWQVMVEDIARRGLVLGISCLALSGVFFLLSYLTWKKLASLRENNKYGFHDPVIFIGLITAFASIVCAGHVAYYLSEGLSPHIEAWKILTGG